jgi:hypothetical protein
VTCPVDHLAIRATISGKAESAADARVKFERMRESYVTAVEALQIPNATLVGSPPSIETIVPGADRNNVFVRGMGADSATPADKEILVSETVIVKIGSIADVPREERLVLVSKVLDCIAESGAELYGTLKGTSVFGGRQSPNQRSQQGVSLEYADGSEGEEGAVKEAIDEAKHRAARIAEAVGFTLGRIKGISQRQSSTEWNWGEGQATYQIEVAVSFEIE